MKKVALFSLFLSILLLSCGKDDDGTGGSGCSSIGTPVPVHFEVVAFKLLDSLGNILIGEFGTPYENKDIDLTFIQENDTITFNGAASSNGVIGVQPALQSDPLNELIKREYYVSFPSVDLFPKEHTDTVRIEFELFENECDVVWFDYFLFSYNDSIYHSGIFTEEIFLITKN